MEMVMRRSLLFATGVPLTLRMMSPFCRPALLRRAVGAHIAHQRARESFSPKALAMAGVTSCGTIPR